MQLPTFSNPIIHLVYPPKFCIIIVRLFWSQEKSGGGGGGGAKRGVFRGFEKIVNSTLSLLFCH